MLSASSGDDQDKGYKNGGIICLEIEIVLISRCIFATGEDRRAGLSHCLRSEVCRKPRA